MAHQEIDLKNPKTNRKNAGFTDEERQKFTELLEAGFIDTFRYFYPRKKAFTPGGHTASAHARKNAGWRIDYFCVSKSLEDHLENAKNFDGRDGVRSLPGRIGYKGRRQVIMTKIDIISGFLEPERQHLSKNAERGICRRAGRTDRK